MRWTMLFLIVMTSTAAAESDVELASAVATACEANRARLTSWTIEFRYTVAKAKSLEDAIAQRWSDESAAKGFCAFDGTRGRFDIVHTLKDMVEKRTEVGPRHFQSHLLSERFLTDGEVTLRDHMSPTPTGAEMRHVVQINPGADLFHRHVHLPLRLGKGEFGQAGTLGAEILLVEKGTGGRLEVQEGVSLRGMELVKFAFTGPDAKASDYTYWIDLEHGAIPRQTLAEHPTPEGTISRTYTILDDPREVGDNVWFPYRRLRYSERIQLVQDLVITKADFTTPRDPSSFQLTFEKPSRVADNVRHVVYAPSTTFDLTRLPNAERSWGTPRSTGNPSGPNTIHDARFTPPLVMPGERPAKSRWRFIAIIALGVMAVAGAVTLQWRRRRDE